MLTHFLRGLLTLTFVAALCWIVPSAAQAQERVFVQIEAHPDLPTAEARLRAYSQLVDNVNGFQATTGLYAVALGPFEPDMGTLVLQQLLGQGLIPRDSFIVDEAIYASQFFPVGATVLGEGTAAAPAAAEEPAAPLVPDETVNEARASEAQLSREDRDLLQIAMAWFDFYNGAIDGAFGPGTRASMTAYQASRGFEQTGILTTRQREQLISEYRGELSALGMQRVRDQRAGIEIVLPMAMVDFLNYNFPFAQFEEANDSGVRIMLISQPGDRSTLFGLYEIMQTLDIVPLDGERERRGDSFLLTGQSDTLRSHTEAQLVGGAVKGFTLIWEPQADTQAERILAQMQSSFTAFAGTLDPASVPEGLDESIDMVSGLTVRRPELLRTGFYVDAQGSVLTTTEVLGQCQQILIDEAYPATIAFRDDALGLAVLRPNQALAPLGFANFAADPARLRAEIAVAGYPFNGALSAASTSFGVLADLRGVNGEETVQRLDVATADSEAGGPVLNGAGQVIGMVLPGSVAGRTLPDEVTLALRADQVLPVLQTAGVGLSLGAGATPLNRENLSRTASDMTVRVSCWN